MGVEGVKGLILDTPKTSDRRTHYIYIIIRLCIIIIYSRYTYSHTAVVRKRFWEPPRKCLLYYTEVGIVNNRVMLWAGTPGAVLGPRHIDWGPGGCARAPITVVRSFTKRRLGSYHCCRRRRRCRRHRRRRRCRFPQIDEAHPTTRNRRIRLTKFQWFPINRMKNPKVP